MFIKNTSEACRTVSSGGIEGSNPRFRLIVTILVGTKIKFELAENAQLTEGECR
jgi:hypothetical protein